MHYWPRSIIFVLQAIDSLMRPPTPLGAEDEGLTAAGATQTSTQPRVQKNDGLITSKRLRSLRYDPLRANSNRRQASRCARPPEARRRCRKKHPAPTRSAPPRARLARGSSQGEWPVFCCCLWALFGCIDAVAYGASSIRLGRIVTSAPLNCANYARLTPRKERIPPPEPHGNVVCDRHPGRSIWS
jgi:hypothetical protein